MGAPKGNQFWKLRSKHGRDAIFVDPVLLRKSANEYFEWCVKHPLKESKPFGSGHRATINHMRPFTLEGLARYVNASSGWWRGFRKTAEKGILSVMKEIEEDIRQQKYEGAACGFFNSNIVARDIGLADKQQIEHTGLNVSERNNLTIKPKGKKKGKKR